MPTDATPEQLQAAQVAIDEAQKAIDDANKQIATTQNVADSINQSGWNVVSKANGGTVSGNQEAKLVNPGSTVELKAGKNIDIKYKKE